MNWFVILLFTLAYGVYIPGNNRELCYNILGSEQNIKIYSSKNLKFDFDTLIVEIVHQENEIKHYGPEQSEEILYLQLKNGKCEYSKLQFSKKTDRNDFWAVIKINFLVKNGSENTVEIFGLELYSNHQTSTVILEGFNRKFAMEVEIVNRAVSFATSYTPPDPNFLPHLENNQFYCLKLWKYGTGLVDQFRPSNDQSKFEKYVRVQFTQKTQFSRFWIEKALMKDWAELSICNKINFEPFPVLIQDKSESQQIVIQISIGENNATAAFQWYPGGKITSLSKESNWEPKGFFVKAVSAATAKNDYGINDVLLFQFEPIGFRCMIGKGEGYVDEFMTDDVILLKETSLETLTAENSGIQIHREMTDEEYQLCKKNKKNPKNA